MVHVGPEVTWYQSISVPSMGGALQFVLYLQSFSIGIDTSDTPPVSAHICSPRLRTKRTTRTPRRRVANSWAVLSEAPTSERAPTTSRELSSGTGHGCQDSENEKKRLRWIILTRGNFCGIGRVWSCLSFLHLKKVLCMQFGGGELRLQLCLETEARRPAAPLG